MVTMTSASNSEHIAWKDEVHVSRWLIDERLRPGAQVFVVGDVHGFPRHLDALLSSMAAVARPGSQLVFLGDLIDRGPDSPGAIAVAAKWMMAGSFEIATMIIGNHDLFYHSLAGRLENDRNFDRRVLKAWMINGAMDMLEALGTNNPFDVRQGLTRAIGTEAVAFYEAGKTHIEIGNILFVHAGIHPRIPTSQWFTKPKLDSFWLEEEDLHWAWIRDPFLFHEGRFDGDRIVVHGHTGEAHTQYQKSRQLKDPIHQIDGWRLGLDGTRSPNPTITGAEIEDGRYRIFTLKLFDVAK
jgi:serine/threonine protein phosphatase 1